MLGASATHVVFDTNSNCGMRNSPCSSSASLETLSSLTTNPETKSDDGCSPKNSPKSKNTHRCFGTFMLTCLRIKEWLSVNLRPCNLLWNNCDLNTSPPCTQDLRTVHQPYWENDLEYGTQALTNTMCEISVKERRRMQEWDALRAEIPYMSESTKEQLYQDLLNAMTLDQRNEFEEMLKIRNSWNIAHAEDSDFVCV